MRGTGARDQPAAARARARGGRRRGPSDPSGRASSRASLGPTNQHGRRFAGRQRPGLRATSPSTSCATPIARRSTRPDRGRRRPAAGRDHVRHAERQGRDLRHRRSLSRRRGERAAGDDLRHDHRPLRAHAVGPDDGGVLELGAPCASRSRSASTARSAPSEMRPHIAELARVADTLRLRLSQCRPAERVRRLRRDARGDHGAAGSANAPRAASSTSSAAAAAPRPAHIRAIAEAVPGCTPRKIPEREPPACASSGWSRFEHRAARSAASSTSASAPTSPARRASRKLIRDGDYDGRARGRAPAGRERRPDHRRQHGRGHARLRGGDGDVPEPDRRRARYRRGAGDDRLAPSGR